MKKINGIEGVVGLVLLFLALVGLLGGIGYTVWQGAYVISVGIAALGWLAYPKAKEIFKTMFL